MRRHALPALLALVSLALALLAPTAAPAQTAGAWPDKPIRFVVPFPPGSISDAVARLVADKLPPALGQRVVVENRGGAGGNIGFAYVARARPDGYTLLLAPNSFAVNVSLYDKAPYDPFKDFVPVAELSKACVLQRKQVLLQHSSELFAGNLRGRVPKRRAIGVVRSRRIAC